MFAEACFRSGGRGLKWELFFAPPLSSVKQEGLALAEVQCRDPSPATEEADLAPRGPFPRRPQRPRAAPTLVFRSTVSLWH